MTSGRTSSTAAVSGSTAATPCSQSGIWLMGKYTPDRKVIGRLTRLATGAAWSSFFAQPAIPKPSARKIIEPSVATASSSAMLPTR